MAFAWLRLGQYDKALEICETRLKDAVQRENTNGQMIALWNEGFVYAEKKAVGEAEKIAEELRSLGPEKHGRVRDGAL